jgi:hypothetical protein
MSRDGLLKETHAFMTEVVARLMPRQNMALTPELRGQLLRRLNGVAGKSAWSLLPNKLQGLIPYIQKTKWYVSILPLAIAVGISISISWFNRWYTQRKNGGNVFFPGEQVFKNRKPGGHA